MKSPSVLLAAAALLINAAAAEIIGVDQFDYPDGAIAGRNSGTFWNYKNTVPTSVLRVTTPAPVAGIPKRFYRVQVGP